MIDTYLYEWGNFKPADRWIAEFETLRARYLEFPSLNIELRVMTGLFAILMYRQAQHPELPAWESRLEAFLFEDVDPMLRVTAANCLVLYRPGGAAISPRQPFSFSAWKHTRICQTANLWCGSLGRQRVRHTSG